jgi:hypothetical protein
VSHLQSLIYVSKAAGELLPKDVAAILQSSAHRNARDGVQGVLLLSDGNFMQCLEGEAAGIERTYARILASPLHRRVIEMFRSPVAKRRFSSWEWAFKMGNRREFSNADTAQFLETPRHDQPVSWAKSAMEQKILREFWDAASQPCRIW